MQRQRLNVFIFTTLQNLQSVTLVEAQCNVKSWKTGTLSGNRRKWMPGLKWTGRSPPSSTPSLSKQKNTRRMPALSQLDCYNPPPFFSSPSDPLLITLSKPPPMAKRPLPLNPPSLENLPLLPPSKPSKPLSPLNQPPVEPLVPVPWNIH